MSLADNALTTLDRLKQYIGIDLADTSQDFKLELLINSASQEIENIIGRKLKKAQRIEKYKGNNKLRFQVKNYPLISINEIKLNNEIVDSTKYDFEENGIIEGTRPWYADGLYSGVTPNLAQRKKNIEIDYVAGYVLPKDETQQEARTLPYDIEIALFRMINGLLTLSEQGAEGLKSFAMSDVRWEWDKEYMNGIKPVLMSYRGMRL